MKSFFIRLLQLVWGFLFFCLCIALLLIQSSHTISNIIIIFILLIIFSGFQYLFFGSFNPKLLYNNTLLEDKARPSSFYKIIAFCFITSILTGITTTTKPYEPIDFSMITGLIFGYGIILGFVWCYFKSIKTAYKYSTLWAISILLLGFFGAIGFFITYRDILKSNEKRTLLVFSIPLTLLFILGLVIALLVPNYI